MTGPRRRGAVNKFNIFVGEGLDHSPPVEVVCIYVGDVAAFYFGVVVFNPHLLVICLGVAFSSYKSQTSSF